MSEVKIKDREIQVGGKKIPLLSGEVHYWRIHPNYWGEVLDRVKELGLDIASTYIPWDYHEYQKGKLDFRGKTDPSRDLVAFMELVRKKKLWLVIRPGPYIYSEWPNEGAPAHAYRYHRLHPQFLKLAKKYMTEVVKVLKPYFATRKNGHIILFQADNEIDPWPDVFGQQYGLDGRPGLFQDFIKKLYGGNLKKLNKRWGTDYKSFNKAGAYIATMLNDDPGLPLKGDCELQRNIDYFRFKYDYSRTYADWVVQNYRKLGVDVPIYLNLYPFFYAHDWISLQEASDAVGVDLYPTAEFNEDAFEQRKFMDKLRYLRSVSTLPFIAEFASGVWHQRHYETGVLTPNHYRLLGLSALLAGAVGWNWYMLVNRDNWYMSPINEWGRVRGELYDVFKEVVTIAKRMQPAKLEKISDIGVTFNPLQYAARTMTHNSPVLVALYESDVDYEMYDARSGVCDKKILFYSGNQWLEPQTQKNLRKYVERGGILAAFRNFPRKDDQFQNCSLVGFDEPSQVLFEFKRKVDVKLGLKSDPVSVVSSVYIFDSPKGQKIQADLGPYGKRTIGYIKKVGKGKILHLGISPTKELILEILKYFKIKIPSRAITPDIKTGLFKRGSTYYLVVTNNGNEDKSASIFLPALDRMQKMQVRDITKSSKQSYPIERRRPFTAEVKRKDGRVFEFKA